MKKPTVALLLISTNKYDQFVQPLLDSVDKYFFTDHEVNVYLFTDKIYPLKKNRLKINAIKIEHKKWPYSTLLRYDIFNRHKHLIKGDTILYSDVDMLFVNNVGEEILNDGLIATMHPGFYKGGWGSQNCDERSLAYLPKEKWGVYYAGGFQGGLRNEYLKMCDILAGRIWDDEKRGVRAEHNDENFWNNYLKTEEGLSIKTLSPSYCYQEGAELPFEKKILALNKNHSEVRS